MTSKNPDYKIDTTTNLPEAPAGYHWHVSFYWSQHSSVPCATVQLRKNTWLWWWHGFYDRTVELGTYDQRDIDAGRDSWSKQLYDKVPLATEMWPGYIYRIAEELLGKVGESLKHAAYQTEAKAAMKHLRGDYPPKKFPELMWDEDKKDA